MNVFTKRNAVVGYVAIKAAGKTLEKRAAKAARKQQKAMKEGRSKLPLYVALGIVSFGILAAFAAYAAKRHTGQKAPPVDEAVEAVGEAAGAAPESVEAAAETVTDVADAVAESVPAA